MTKANDPFAAEKACSKCGTVKAMQLFPKAANRVDGHAAQCKMCAAEWAAQNYIRNTKKILSQNLAWAEAHPEARRRIGREWRKDNPEAAKAWVAENVEKLAVIRARWNKKHAHKVAAFSSRRRASRVQATPAWANRDAISRIYATAAEMTMQTGVQYHVDHVIPLRSKLVCGLHVETNFQILPATENAKKGNRHWPDMPGAPHE
ncbi:MAG: hypothetical protein PHW66_09610 [Gallionella sp.]|nr:hypothetical protein [Gallionella sp.]